MRMHAAIAAALALLLLAEGAALATSPFPTRRFHSASGKIEVRLNPTVRQGALEILRAVPPEPTRLGLADLGPDLERAWARRLTTAGTHWYRNALGLFSQDQAHFFLRTDSGALVVLDLARGRAVPRPSRALRDEADRGFRAMAPTLLGSEEPVERETGALASGQLGLRETIPALRALLADDAYVSVYPAEDPAYAEYFVREAAKRALEALGEQVTGVETRVELVGPGAP
jgi:hypothetical protein